MEAVWRFAEMDAVYAQFKPLTPYGRARKEARQILCDSQALAFEHSISGAALSFMKRAPSAADKVEFHLKSIPLLDNSRAVSADITEILLYKKLLYHVRGLEAVIPKGIRRQAGLNWESERLLERLQLGGAGETFYLSDKYSACLARARRRAVEAERKFQAAAEKELRVLRKRFGLDFTTRQFVIMPDRQAQALDHGGLLFLERYDGGHMTVKPVYGFETLRLMAERERLCALEKKEESVALRELAGCIGRERAKVDGYLRAVEKIDTAFARARLALAYGLKRPLFIAAGKPIGVRGGRLLALEQGLAEKRLKYTPLDFEFGGGRVSVISGSNMGGKTVVLKTMAQLQLMAQCGFFVPAREFRTVLFPGIYYAGCGSIEPSGGLSSFGQELHKFMQAYSRKERPALFLLDEFARTTNADEASALLSAIVEAFAADKGVYAFVATHFSDLKTARGAAFYRMRGLDGFALSGVRGKGGGDLQALLKDINRYMRYELRRDCGKTRIYDALTVAAMLGFDAGITGRAVQLMEGRHESKAGSSGKKD